MDYNSFLKRDYKSLGEPLYRRSRFRWSRLHLLLLAAATLVAGTLLTLASREAEATRAQAVTASPARITLPLPVNVGPEDTTAAAPVPDTAPRWQNVRVRRGDTLSAIFSRLGLPQGELQRVLAAGGDAAGLRRLRPGQTIRVRAEAGRLLALVHERGPLESLRVHREGDGFTARLVQRELERRITYSAGTIENSLFESATAAGLSQNLVMELAGIFGWDVDFALDIRRGDRFRVIYEEQYLDGRKVGEGPILVAEFVNQGRRFHAVRYTDPEGRTDYYTPEGLSMRKAFLRTPVDFTRIASRFGRRRHPILNRMRVHKGVDYAARRGTPVKAAGDGRVIFRGRKGGYGRTIIIQHGGRYSTLYAHLSGYRRGLRVGRRVKQGQVIGYVGSSGLATGPHLHYEFRVNGVHRNPLTVKLPNARPIARRFRDDFLLHARRLMAQLDAHGPTRVARAP